MSQYPSGYIDPRQLVLTEQSSHSQGRSGSRSHRSGTGNAHKQAHVDPAVLATDAVHLLERRTYVSPQAILDGSRPSSMYRPYYFLRRRPEYSGTPGMPSYVFTVQGELGPYVLSLLKPDAQLDGAYDHIMEGHGWRRIQYAIDWPGTSAAIERTPTHDSNGAPVTRHMVAREMCARLMEILKKRYPDKYAKVEWRKLRLIALSFYGCTWVPVWAMDAPEHGH